MTEQSKIQLGTEVDATGAAQGFEKVKQGARDMAQGVVQAGQAAGKGMDAIADGAKRAADGFSREEGRLRASIQRATIDLQTLGGTASQKLEAKINLQGLDPAKFQPYLAALKQTEEAQRAVAQSQASSSSSNSFLTSLQGQAAAIGKTKADLLEMKAAELGLATAAAPYIAKLREAEQGHNALGGSAQFSTQQIQGLTHAVRGAFDSIASGQSPIRAVAVETGRLSGTFGGVGNAVSAVASLITPFRLALVGGAAALAGLGLAAYHAESSLRELNTVQAQLAGTGRAGLFDNAGLKAFINELSLAPGVTRASATAIISELSKVHDVGGGLFKDLGKLAVDYAKATGTDIPTAAKTLAQAFADPEKGAKELDKTLGTLTSTQILTIEKLARLGDIAGAQRALVDALNGSLKGLAEKSMTPLQDSIDKLGKAWERVSRAFGESEGLRSFNASLAVAVGLVTSLVDKLPQIAAAAPSFKPGSAVAEGIRFDQQDRGVNPPAAGLPTGDFSRRDRAAGISAGGRITTKSEADDEIKRALDAGKAYKSQAGQIAELRDQRERLNKALKESIDLYGKDSPQAKQLKDNVAGINERIASIGKKGSTSNHEPQQVLDAQLEQSIKAARDALVEERDQLSFSQRFLQGVYQQGQISLRDFYEQKRQAIQQGVAAEVAELEKERTAVQAHLDATKKTSPTDTSALVKDQTRLQEIDAQQGKLRSGAARETVLANQEEAASFKQLGDQVLNYRASLLQLQGDEAGAAKVRAQLAIEQARVLAKQSGGTISDDDVKALAKATQQTNDLTTARAHLNETTQLLALQEDRITFLQGRGDIGEIEALGRLGQARSARLGQLQKEVDELEKLAKARPLDLQLNVDASRARLELDKFKAQLDPLKDKFDSLFKDAGANLFADLANGTKPRDALKNFANTITKEINATVGKELSTQLFGDGGAFGGLGKFTADIFGGKSRKGVSLDTSSAEQSLTSLRTTGVDPATTALTALGEAAQATAVQLRQVTGTPIPPAGTAGDFARYDRAQGTGVPVADGSGETGDFSRFDRAQDKAVEATTAGAKADQNAARAVTQLAAAAANGGSALNSLPAILASLSSAGGYGNPGGLIGAGLSGLGSLFGGGGAAAGAGAAVDLGTASGADLALFFSSGGYTGDVDPRKAAGIVHGKEYVFSAEATQAIGVDRLERLHKMAKTGRLNEGGSAPGYYDGGYVSGWQSSGMNYLVPPQQTQGGGAHVTHHHHYEVAVQAAPGMSRATSMQIGADVGRGIELSRVRNGKRSGR